MVLQGGFSGPLGLRARGGMFCRGGLRRLELGGLEEGMCWRRGRGGEEECMMLVLALRQLRSSSMYKVV